MKRYDGSKNKKNKSARPTVIGLGARYRAYVAKTDGEVRPEEWPSCANDNADKFFGQEATVAAGRRRASKEAETVVKHNVTSTSAVYLYLLPLTTPFF
jgi:hypothetical protein